MKTSLSVLLLLFTFGVPAFAQKTNDAISKQIKSLKADKNLTLTFDGKTSKLMATGESVDQKEASRAGIQAMNFGMAFFYPGQELKAAPQIINLTFWVLSKKPRFAGSNKWAVALGTGNLDLGDAQYAAKSGSNMEYLNFKVPRADLEMIAAGNGVKFKLGTADFTFTPVQLITLRNFLSISAVP
jgi:hypothetical protein